MTGKIAKNVYWALGGKVSNLLSALVVGIMVARYLGPEQYGLMNYVVSYVTLFQVLSAFGLDSIEIREEARADRPVTTTLGTSFAVRVILSVVFMALTIITSWQMDADGETTWLVAVYSLSIPLNCFMVIRNYFSAIVQNAYVVQVEIGRTLLGMGIKIVLLWIHAELVWFVAFSMFDFVLTGLGYVAAYRVKVGPLRDWRYDRACAAYLLRESWPLLLTNAAVILYQRIDQVMIGQLLDKRSVGYFSVAGRFVEVLTYIPMILSQTVMPVLVSERGKGEEVYGRSAQRFMNISVWLSLLASAVTSVLAWWLVTILFGQVYAPAVVILQVMAFKAASVALSSTAGAMLVAEGLQRYAFWRDLFGCLVCVSLNWLLLPAYGVVAAAWVAIMSNIAAGFVADAFIPAYRHIFVRQCRALVTGWRELGHIRTLLKH